MPVDKHKDNMITVHQFIHTFLKGFSILLLTNDILLGHKQLFYQVLDLGNDGNLFCSALSWCMYAFRLQCTT